MDGSFDEWRLQGTNLGNSKDTLPSTGGDSPVHLTRYPVYDSIERRSHTKMDDNQAEAVEVDVDFGPQSQQALATRRRARVEETMLFFVSAVGSTIGWTSVLSNLVFYTETLGVNSYLYLNLCIYAPLLPITIAQTLWDADFDRQFTSLRSFAIRGSTGFAVTLVSVILLAPASANHSMIQVSLLSLSLGMSSGILHGVLKQMASFVYPGCGRLAAAVTAGLQASAVGVLAISLGTSSKSVSDASWLYHFYGAIAALVVICWLGFRRLMTHSQDVYRSMLRRDSSIQLSTVSLDANEDNDDGDNSQNLEACDLVNTTSNPPLDGIHDEEGDSNDEDQQIDQPLLSSLSDDSFPQGMPTMQDLFWKSWPLCLANFLTVASSMAVASWFNRVPSAHHGMAKVLPQILFYTRLFADLLSRPCTLCLHHDPHERETKQSLGWLMVLVFVRLLFVPYFFLYSTTSLFPRSDMAMILGVLGFAFSSGFINTWVYQLAPHFCIPFMDGEQNVMQQRHPNDDIVLKQTNLLNVCFSISILFGLMGSLSLSGFGMSGKMGVQQ